MTQTLKFLTAQLEDRCHSTTSPKTTYFLFLSKHHGIFTDFSQLKVTGSPRWRERRCQNQLNHKPRSRSRHLGDSRCTRALEFSEFLFDWSTVCQKLVPEKDSPQFAADFPQTVGFRCPILFVGGIGSLLITWDFGWGLGRVGGM